MALYWENPTHKNPLKAVFQSNLKQWYQQNYIAKLNNILTSFSLELSKIYGYYLTTVQVSW